MYVERYRGSTAEAVRLPAVNCVWCGENPSD